MSSYPTRTVTGWRVGIDYRRLNDATRKDHFHLPFIDQMLERIAGYGFYYVFYGYSGYNQIPIAPEDRIRQLSHVLMEHMPTEKFLEIFMDDFTLFGIRFEHCLHHLTLVIKRYEETNLILNWEKCHFMVTEGIILGHKITAKGIEVDKAKIDLIQGLPLLQLLKALEAFLVMQVFTDGS